MDTLKQYFEKILEEKERALAAALAAAERATTAALISAEKAVTKAEESQLRVNIGQNEFRGALKDQAATLLPRAEAEVRIGGLEEKVAELTVRINAQADRKSGVGSVWTVAAMVLAAVALIAGILIPMVMR